MLTALQVKNLGEGRHHDEKGLYLIVAGGSRTWAFRYMLRGRRRVMSLGPIEFLTLVKARERVEDLRRQVRDKIDPMEVRATEVAAKVAEVVEQEASAAHGRKTFEAIAAEFIKARRAEWRGGKSEQVWSSQLERCAFPLIGKLALPQITVDLALRMLTPLWSTTPESANRLRNRCELVWNYGRALAVKDGADAARWGHNPFEWRGTLSSLLADPAKVKRPKHLPALPFTRVAEFMVALRAEQGVGARALELAVLCASRSGEVRLAEWSEFDLDAGQWVIPGARMKTKKEHRVPLSAAAVALLKAMPRAEGASFVFVTKPGGRAISDMTISATIRRMNEPKAEGDKPRWVDKASLPVVPHGFRSSFRDWVAEATTYPNEMAELALAHAVGSKVEAAYRRGDMLARRQAMMEDWARYCGTLKVDGAASGRAENAAQAQKH